MAAVPPAVPPLLFYPQPAMKPRPILASLLLALSVLTPAFANEDHTPLDDRMSAMNKAFRQLKKQAPDASQNAASLELVAKLKKAAAASAELDPAKTAELPEADRAAFAAKYKEEMKKFLATVDRLEAAFKAGDNAEAAKLVAELGKMQRAGHKEFRKPQE